MEIARRLVQAREAAGMTRAEAVRQWGGSYTYLQKLESGENSPPAWPLIAKLAELYGVSVDWLLGNTDDSAPPAQRRMPMYGADILAMLRDMPEQYQHQAAAHVRAVYEAAKLERERYELAYWFAETFGQELYDELADTLRELVRTVGTEAALDELERRFDLLRGRGDIAQDANHG